jgi:hypothetical protein
VTTSIPTNEPKELRAGLTWQWRRENLTDYPASVWTLTYWFKKTGSSGANFSIVAAPDGDAFAIEVAKATTAGYTAGDYTWAALVGDGTDQFEVDKGTTVLLPRYDAAANLDDRSHAAKVLDAIESVIENRATKDQEEYSIAGRSLKRTPLEELMKLRDTYRAEVYAEEQAELVRNGGSAGKIVARL